MSTLSLVLLLSGITSIALLACYLDAKFQWRLNDWMNGKCSNPFIASNATTIETLEAIVTEPAYELNKKINALK
jgi:hypothetical protein